MPWSPLPAGLPPSAGHPGRRPGGGREAMGVRHDQGGLVAVEGAPVNHAAPGTGTAAMTSGSRRLHGRLGGQDDNGTGAVTAAADGRPRRQGGCVRGLWHPCSAGTWEGGNAGMGGHGGQDTGGGQGAMTPGCGVSRRWAARRQRRHCPRTVPSMPGCHRRGRQRRLWSDAGCDPTAAGMPCHRAVRQPPMGGQDGTAALVCAAWRPCSADTGRTATPAAARRRLRQHGGQDATAPG